MKDPIYIFIAIVLAFTVGCVLLRETIDTVMFRNITCAHTEHTTAVLESKTPQGACYFRVADDKNVSEQWFTCGNIEIGQTIPYDRNNTDCNDLIVKVNK